MASIAAASTSMASTAVFTTHLSLCSTAKAASFCCSALPYLPPRVSASAISTSFKFSESKRSSLLQVKASSSEETSVDTSEFITELKEKWDAVEDKTTVLLYGGGAIVAVWISSSSPFLDPSKIENIVKNFSSKQESLPLSFGSIGSLPSDDNVLFLAPTPTLSLLQFHSQLYDAMKKEGIEIAEEHRPDTWIPYCPVADEVPKTRMGEAFTVLRDLKLPVAGYATEIALVEYPPVREAFSFVLGNTVEP